MTCIVGLVDKKNNKMYIGGDRLGSNGYSKTTISNPKIFKKGKLLLGYTTSFRFGQILEMYFNPPKNKRSSSYEYIIKDVLPEMRKILENHKYSKDDHSGKSGELIIMHDGNCFKLQCDWSVLECNKYLATGSGEIAALGALEALNKINTPYKHRVKIALQSAAEHITSVKGPFDIITVNY